MGSGQFAQLPWGEDVDGVYPLDVCAVDLEGILAAAASEAGVVDKDVDRAVNLDREVDEGLQVLFLQHVACRGRGLASGLYDSVGRGLGLLCRKVAHHHRCAGRGENLASPLSYAVATPGDNCDFARKVKG